MGKKDIAVGDAGRLEELVKRCRAESERIVKVRTKLHHEPCVVCVHAWLDEINRHLITNASNTGVARQFEVKVVDVIEHYQRHVRPFLFTANQTGDLVVVEKKLALLTKARGNRSFPRNDYKKQLEYIAQDLLLCRRLYFGDITEDGTVVVAPSGRGITLTMRTLMSVVRELEEVRRQEQKKQTPTTIGNPDEIDSDLLSDEQQKNIDEAKRRNQEAIDDATQSIRADGLPKTRQGFNWRKSNQPDTHGIIEPIAKEDSPDPEGERSFADLTRID